MRAALLSQTAAGRQPGRTPWESQPKRQAVHEPTRPTTYRTLRPLSHTLEGPSRVTPDLAVCTPWRPLMSSSFSFDVQFGHP